MDRLVSNEDMLIAEDALITEVQFAIHNLLVKKAVSRRELARRMGVTESHISQIFKDNSRNLTLKTVARIFRAVEEEPRITSETLDELIPSYKRCGMGGAAKTLSKSAWLARILNDPSASYTECNDNEAALVA